MHFLCKKSIPTAEDWLQVAKELVDSGLFLTQPVLTVTEYHQYYSLWLPVTKIRKDDTRVRELVRRLKSLAKELPLTKKGKL